jgi:hypothetical protein
LLGSVGWNVSNTYTTGTQTTAIRPEFIRDSFGIHSGFIVRAYFNLSTGHLHLQGEVAGRIGKEDMERTKEEQQVSGLLTSVSEWKLA